MEDRELAYRAGAALKAIFELRACGAHALISCSKTKETHSDLARDLYTSPMYKKSVLLIEGLGISYDILSAKFGLLNPEKRIEPYDITLKGQPSDFIRRWSEKVVAAIDKQIPADNALIALAGDDYLSPLRAPLANRKRNVFEPMKGLSLGSRLAFLNHAMAIKKRLDGIKRAYELFERLSKMHGLCSLEESLNKTLPTHGVYFFFDPDEPTRFSTSIPRLVRVGTHGVSVGSKATLRNRLRAHFGTRAGMGNHRASVFRLHVGRALIERDGLLTSFPSWGKGQSAPRHVQEIEAPLEAKVSEYIRNLRLTWVPILDKAGTSSMRATVERQFIALFTEHHYAPDESTQSWLGRFSDRSTIRETGLWNVRDIGSPYDSRFLKLFEWQVCSDQEK